MQISKIKANYALNFDDIFAPNFVSKFHFCKQ